jgi:ParB family chromosome partitioning protein
MSQPAMLLEEEAQESLLPAGDILPAIEAAPAERLLPAQPEEKLLAQPVEPIAAIAPIPQPAATFAAPAASEIAPVMPAAVPAAGAPAKAGKAARSEAVFYLETDKIKPNQQQPRRHFDEEAIADLSASIREFGIIQPIVVTKIQKEVPNGTEVEYELIAGERRLLAAKKAGLERVPAIVRVADMARERLELAVIENLQRENLNSIEMARAFARLQDEFRLTQREIAARLGKSREVVANTLRLLDLPGYIQEALEKNQITESHGRLLLSIDDTAAQQSLFHDLLNQHLTTRELRRRTLFLRKKEPAAEEEGSSPEIRAFEERLKNELGAPVSIRANGSGGKITIEYYSSEELAQIMERLGTEEF